MSRWTKDGKWDWVGETMRRMRAGYPMPPVYQAAPGGHYYADLARRLVQIATSESCVQLATVGNDEHLLDNE